MGHISLVILSCFYLTFTACNKSDTILEPYDVVNKWVDMTLYITKNTGSNSPTYASRCLGYIGLTMYESIVESSDEYISIAPQLNGLNQMPEVDTVLDYNWLISLNAAEGYILKNLYAQTVDSNKLKIDQLEIEIKHLVRSNGVKDEVIRRSEAYGRAVARSIFEWSKTDGGHRGYLQNFDKEWIHPVRPGAWQPPLFAQSFSHHPLHPHWGKNRTFLKSNSEIELPQMIPYDTSKTSLYYKQFEQVYNKDLTLTQEEKEAAIWWGDDPDETFTPPGHSFYLASLLVAKEKPDLVTAAMTFAKVGMSVADAFINCWKWKYHFFSERPNTFIPKYIDIQWESFWPDPPFPAFPSGHAIQAAAMATALISIYGNDHQIIDRAHVGRARDRVRDVDFVERRFSRIWDIAEETANSRFYGGIHVLQDNEVGLREGARIAENINGLKWRR